MNDQDNYKQIVKNIDEICERYKNKCEGKQTKERVCPLQRKVKYVWKQDPNNYYETGKTTYCYECGVKEFKGFFENKCEDLPMCEHLNFCGPVLIPHKIKE